MLRSAAGYAVRSLARQDCSPRTHSHHDKPRLELPHRRGADQLSPLHCSCATARETDASGLELIRLARMPPATVPMAFGSAPPSHARTDTDSVRMLNAQGRRTGEVLRLCPGTTPEPREHPCADFPRQQPGNQLARRMTPRHVHRERGREAPLARPDLPSCTNAQPSSRRPRPPFWQPVASPNSTSAQRLALSCVDVRERSDRGPRQLQRPICDAALQATHTRVKSAQAVGIEEVRASGLPVEPRQHRLYFLPEPQVQGSLRPTFDALGGDVTDIARTAALRSF